MRKFLTLLVMVMFTTFAMAQNKTVTGKVTDEKGAPVANASVLVKGTTKGVTTNNDGSFSISVPATAKTLVVSSVGFTAKDVSIKGSSLNVSLQASSATLDEVVITGYSREKKSQFSGAASVVGAKSIETVPVGAFDQVLQGRVPGMVVNSGTGQPGSSANVTIRGIQSISGAGVQPLYVIDGIPLPAGDFQTLNPNDFETITVLKDASAAALYGARGGLGVIVITTKKGKAGQANFTFRTQYGQTSRPGASNFTPMTSEEMLRYEEFVGSVAGGVTGPGWLYSKKNPRYNILQAGFTTVAQQQSRYDFLIDSFKNNNVNFFDVLFKTGVTQSHELNMSGGNANTRYFMSAGVFDQQGTDLKSKLRRYTTRFNLDNTMGKFTLQFNTALGFSITDINEGSFYAASGTANPFAMAFRAKPYENPYRADGSLIFGPSSPLNPTAVGNLIERSNNTNWIDKQFKMNSGLTLIYRITPNVTAKNVVGLDFVAEYGTGAINANSYVGSLQTFNSGFLNETFRNRTQIINTSSLNFNKKFGKSEVDVAGFFETVQGFQKGFGANIFNLDPRLTGTGQGAGALTTGGAATIGQNANSAKSGFGIVSYFGTARYTYDGKYTINGAIRRDGTSRILNPDNKNITTFSAGATWEAIKEGFMKKQSFFTDLRFRYSYGVVPNIGSIATSTYGLSSSFYSVTNFLGPQVPSFGGVNFAGSTITGLAPTTPGNPNLRIETIAKSNFGVEFAIWKNRARFTVDIYNNRTKDLFVSQPLPANAGFGVSSLPINAGVMTNKGVELDVKVDVVKSKDYDVTLGWNHAINNNVIEDLGAVNEYQSGTGIIRKGLPFGSHYSYNYLGADPTTGRPVYEKPDGTSTTILAEAGQFAKFGTYLPRQVGGFTLDVRVRRITLSALFSYQFQVVRSNNALSWFTRGDVTYTNAVRQSSSLFNDQWQKPGDVKMIQSPLYDRQFTSYDLGDAKFLRFRNLTAAYQLPAIKTASGTVLIKSARFYVQGQNLAIWSPWKGLDPEDDNNISLGEFPNPRAFVVGLDINF
jgi:TonB-linked SusC/RagA family outer membrane protein